MSTITIDDDCRGYTEQLDDKEFEERLKNSKYPEYEDDTNCERWYTSSGMAEDLARFLYTALHLGDTVKAVQFADVFEQLESRRPDVTVNGAYLNRIMPLPPLGSCGDIYKYGIDDPEAVSKKYRQRLQVRALEYELMRRFVGCGYDTTNAAVQAQVRKITDKIAEE